MGQLTNQFVSQSYQGLLNLENANTGVTATLQYVTDGVGNRLPMLASTSSIVITGSFRGDGSGLTGVTATVDSGSLVTTSSFNAYTSSVNLHLAGLDVETGSLQNQINGLATTSSLNTLSGSIAVTDLAQNNRLTSLEQFTGSIDTGYVSEAEFGAYTSSMNNFTSSIDSRVDSLEIATSSLQNQINQKLDTGSFNTYTSSVDAHLAALDIETGSLQNQIDGLATTGSLSGYTTITAFNNYTSSNDSKVNSLIASTGSYATTSSLTALSQSIATTDLGQDNRLGSLESKTGSYATTGSNTFTGNQIINVSPTASLQLGDGSGAVSLQNSGNGLNVITDQQRLVVNNNGVQVTGSVNITGNITATSASFTYVNTVYETASVIYSSGSNQLGDASDDTQTLWGTVILPSGSLNITGSLRSTGEIRTDGNVVVGNTLLTNGIENPAGVGDITINSGLFKVSIVGDTEVTGTLKVTGGITGSLQGTASFATNALSASYAPQDPLPSGLVSSSAQISYTGITDVPSGIISGSGQISDLGFATTGSVNQKLDTGSFNSYTASMDARTGSYATTGSNRFVGNQTITGSVTISGSAQVELDVKGDQINTGSLSVISGSIYSLSNTTPTNYSNFLTNSFVGQANIIRGWGDNLNQGGAGATLANYTGSISITGSNNIVSVPQLRATAFGGGNAGMQGYISGSENIILSNNAGIFLNTGSLLFPKVQSNTLGNGSSITMNFTTSSLAGGHPVITNNFIQGGNIQLNSNSGSFTAVGTNIINGGSIVSTQNFVTNTRVLITQNNVNNTTTLNHISSSITYQSNISNAPITVNNHVSSSGIANNFVSVANNVFLGGSNNNGHVIYVSGSQSSNSQRFFTDNLIGGRNNFISSSFVSSSNSNLLSSLIYGQALFVSGNHPTTAGGSAFLGRYNDATTLHLAQDIVLAVGTGTSNVNRRTGLYVTSGSLVGVSGSLDVKGNSTITGSLSVSGEISSTQSSGQEGGQLNLALAQTGNLLTGSIAFDVYESRVRLFEQGGSNRGGYFAINEMTAGVGSKLGPLNGAQYSTLQTLSGSANVSQSVYFDTTGPQFGVSLVDNTKLTVTDAGTYNIQFSAQLVADGGSDNVFIWFKKNGTNIAGSASEVLLDNNKENIMTVNILDTANANDYYEIAWENNNNNGKLLYQAASGNVPSTPSVITTITQIR